MGLGALLEKEQLTIRFDINEIAFGCLDNLSLFKRVRVYFSRMGIMALLERKKLSIRFCQEIRGGFKLVDFCDHPIDRGESK